MAATDLNIAKRLARQLWGEINEQKKVMKGVWYFSCSGHGGYVVDLNIHPQFSFKMTQVIKRGYIYASEQHFAVLEEDCDWALFELEYYSHLNTNLDKKKIQDYVNTWNPDWCSACKKVDARRVNELSKMLYDRDEYVDTQIVANGLLALYEYYLGTPIEEIPPFVRLKLRDNCFVFGREGTLKSEPELAFC